MIAEKHKLFFSFFKTKVQGAASVMLTDNHSLP